MREDQTIEWKESWRDEYLKWVCGFANAQGDSGMTQRAVSRRLGLTDGSGVSRAIAEFNQAMARDGRLKRSFHKAERRIAKH